MIFQQSGSSLTLSIHVLMVAQVEQETTIMKPRRRGKNALPTKQTRQGKKEMPLAPLLLSTRLTRALTLMRRKNTKPRRTRKKSSASETGTALAQETLFEAQHRALSMQGKRPKKRKAEAKHTSAVRNFGKISVEKLPMILFPFPKPSTPVLRTPLRPLPMPYIRSATRSVLLAEKMR